MPPTDQPATPDDPQASLRAELLGQIVAAQFDLEAVVTELTRTGGNAGDAQNQLQFLSSLQRTVGAANPVALAQMRSEISATVNAAQAVAAQGRNAASADDKPDRAMTAAEARQAIADVGRDVFGRRVLDPYLRFASVEDEEAYRKREEENSKAYERELAKGTPDGDRRAAEILRTQLVDARAHGAGDSPDFDSLFQRADGAATALDTAQRQPSTERSSTRTPIVAEDRGDTPTDTDLDSVLATLRTAGITTPEQANGAPAHGLAANARPAPGELGTSSGRSA